ncbi:DUF4363 family protein [Clostridium sp.]|uniref:DUF4363 family protein n=1 Tax=Clostridium sp. TaxID=1506 RepID=UPI0039957873
MKKTIISLFIFISIFSFAIYSHYYLLKVGNNIVIKCSEIETILKKTSLKEEDNINNPIWKKLNSKSIDLENYIYNNYNMLSLYLNHERLDIIIGELARLKQYTINGDLKESLSTIAFIKSYTSTIIKEEDINLRNIF